MQDSSQNAIKQREKWLDSEKNRYKSRVNAGDLSVFERMLINLQGEAKHLAKKL
jgi:hypothetical protein